MKKFSIRTSRLLAGAAVAAAALFAACTADTEDVPVRVPLRFAVSMPEDWDDPDATRSATDKALPTRTESIADIESFGVFAYVEGNTSEPYMNNVKVTKSSDNTWSYEGDYYFLGGKSIIFFAYAPYANGTSSITVEGTNLTYMGSSEDNPDLLIADTLVQPTDEVALEFSHALSKVIFKVSETETETGTETYTGFTLSNIATSRTLEPKFAQDESDTPKWTWNLTSTTKGKFSGTLGTDYYMLPQERIESTITTTMTTEGESTTDKTGTLTGTWAANTQYTYTLSTTSGS